MRDNYGCLWVCYLSIKNLWLLKNFLQYFNMHTNHYNLIFKGFQPTYYVSKKVSFKLYVHAHFSMLCWPFTKLWHYTLYICQGCIVRLICTYTVSLTTMYRLSDNLKVCLFEYAWLWYLLSIAINDNYTVIMVMSGCIHMNSLLLSEVDMKSIFFSSYTYIAGGCITFGTS